jgi:predicted permease
VSRLTRVVLHLFPAEFRRRYGDELVEVLALRTREVRQRGGWYDVARLWAHQGIDLLRAAWAERRSDRHAGAPAGRRGKAVAGRRRPPRSHFSGPGGAGGGSPRFRASSGQDIRYALRTLWGSPAFTLVAIVTLALGIGATTAIFTVVDGVLLRPLPYPEPDALVAVYHRFPAMGFDRGNHTSSAFLTYREENRTFEQLGAWYPSDLTVTGLEEPERVGGVAVTEGVLRALAVPPLLGRLFSEDDTSPDAPFAVVLGHGYWQRRFGGDRGIVGRTLRVEGATAEVIGVMPPDFRFLGREPSLYAPIQLDADEMPTVLSFDYRVIGRLRPAVGRAEATADLERLIPVSIERYAWVAAAQLEEWGLGANVMPLKESVVGDVGAVLWLLLGTVSLVLVIACTNVANLFLVRAEGRRSEVAVRTALGASRGRLAAQFLVESGVLAAGGGILGLAIAYASVPALLRLVPVSLPRAMEISVSPAVLAFAALVSGLAGLIFGLFPLAGLGSPVLVAALKDEKRGGGPGRRGHRVRTALAIVEVALALVLMIGAGLMVRSFEALRGVDPGFSEPEQALAFRLSLPHGEVPDDNRAIATYEQILDRIARIPGVSHVGATSGLTMEGRSNQNSLMAEGTAAAGGEAAISGAYKAIAGDYLGAMGIPLRAGRPIDWDDIRNRRPVGLVSETLARQFWGDPALAIGKRIRHAGNDPWREIIGVVGDVRDGGLRSAPRPIAYWPVIVEDFLGFDVWLRRDMAFVVRTEGRDPLTVLPEVRAAVWAVNRNLPLADVRRLDELVARNMGSESFTLIMLVVAAAVAVLLGTVGVYGVIAYVFAQRTRELGIRAALGASRASILGMVLRQGAVVGLCGAAIGLAAAAAASRFLSSLVFGIGTIDAATYALAALAMIAVALVASYIPARRATRLDPAASLRWR